ncbi:MAG TPA: hypothetical protein VFX21_15775 [Acidimicrobiia bacterium]|nr:hypothetical protein [Acidimicrobiia bacterium]
MCVPSHYPVPTNEAIRAILADIVGGRAVTVALSQDPADTDAPGVLADYSVDDGPVGVLCVADLSLSNVVGAAIAAETSEQVDAAVNDNQIADATIENWNEVVNQIARLFNSPDTPTLRVREVRRLPAELPNDVNELLATPLARRAFDVEVADLGKGTLAVVVG